MSKPSNHIMDSLCGKLKETLRADLHARRHYREATTTDVARDLRVTGRTIRNHRKALAMLGIHLPPIRGKGRPRKSAA